MKQWSIATWIAFTCLWTSKMFFLIGCDYDITDVLKYHQGYNQIISSKVDR